MSYVSNHYIPQPYHSSFHLASHTHVEPPSTEITPRKRPKYTRSKTGCLTCRAKKIKCDETKPICTRCHNGQRECVWPEGVSTRRKSTPKKEYVERSGTACSSGRSEGSASSTPPMRPSLDLCQNSFDTFATHRSHDLYTSHQSMPPVPDHRRQQSSGSSDHAHEHAYSYQSSNAHTSSSLYETSSYIPHTRYDPEYGNSRVTPGHFNPTLRAIGHHPSSSQWNAPIMPSTLQQEPFYTLHDRNLLAPYNNQHGRSREFLNAPRWPAPSQNVDTFSSAKHSYPGRIHGPSEYVHSREDITGIWNAVSR